MPENAVTLVSPGRPQFGYALGAAVSGRFPLTTHDFGVFVLAQCVWYFTVAVQLGRSRI
jgi:hypothetical protein